MAESRLDFYVVKIRVISRYLFLSPFRSLARRKALTRARRQKARQSPHPQPSPQREGTLPGARAFPKGRLLSGGEGRSPQTLHGGGTPGAAARELPPKFKIRD